jgi:hypothetical protein
MQRIIELGDGPRVYARYNTNLSRCDYRGVDLYRDILSGIRDWQICASIDGTGATGEYIRTGLNYQQWVANYQRGLDLRRHTRQMRLDFTLTLPGMFEITAIQDLARQLDSEILAKVVFSFSPDIMMSPLALPRELLEPWVDELVSVSSGALRDVLIQLKSRPTFQEQWPDQWQAGLARGKARVLKLESIRSAPTSMGEILAQRPDILKWWNEIA